MSHDGNFDRFDVGQEFCGGWKMRRTCTLSNTDQNPVASRNPQTSAQLFGIELGPHTGAGPGGVGKVLVCIHASSIVLRLSLLLQYRHAVP